MDECQARMIQSQPIPDLKVHRYDIANRFVVLLLQALSVKWDIARAIDSIFVYDNFSGIKQDKLINNNLMWETQTQFAYVVDLAT